MEIVSETIDENGKKHLVVKYTEEEKAKMQAELEAMQNGESTRVDEEALG